MHNYPVYVQYEERQKLEARVCYGCKKPGGTTAILNAYWHLACFRRAPAAKREEASRATSDDPDRL